MAFDKAREGGSKTAWLIVALFVALAVYLALYAEGLAAQVMASGNVGFGLLIYLLSNPAYLLIIAGIVVWKDGGFGQKLKSFIAGLFIVEALDAISLPRCVPSGGLPTESLNFLCSDTLVVKGFTDAGIAFGNAWWLYYLVLPVVLVVAALYLLGALQFVKKVKSFGRP